MCYIIYFFLFICHWVNPILSVPLSLYNFHWFSNFPCWLSKCNYLSFVISLHIDSYRSISYDLLICGSLAVCICCCVDPPHLIHQCFNTFMCHFVSFALLIWLCLSNISIVIFVKYIQLKLWYDSMFISYPKNS